MNQDQELDAPISSLVGRPARVYHTGDMLTQDFVEERVNIELSESEEIISISFG